MYGLVLEGGGAKGSYHIGAYKALKEMDIEISGVAGTSIGAINSALIIQDNWKKSYDLWYNINLSKLFNLDEKLFREIKGLNFNHNNISYIYTKLKYFFNNRGIDLKKIRELLTENINEDFIRQSGKDFGIVTINLSKMEPMELYLEGIPEGKLVDYLIASSYLPAFKMEKMDGSLYLDGGFYDNLPISLLVNRGYKDIIAVRTFAIGRIRDIDNKNLNITYISPDEYLGSTLDFEKENTRYNIKLGYYDTFRVFKRLRGSKYYIDFDHEDKPEDLFIDFFLKLNKKQLKYIGEILNIKNLKGRRMLFERVIPKLIILLGIDDKCSYEDVVIALLECAAKRMDIERFKIYNYSDFIFEVSRNIQDQGVLESKNIPSFVRQNDLLSRAVSEEILKDITDVIFSNID